MTKLNIKDLDPADYKNQGQELDFVATELKLHITPSYNCLGMNFETIISELKTQIDESNLNKTLYTEIESYLDYLFEVCCVMAKEKDDYQAPSTFLQHFIMVYILEHDFDVCESCLLLFSEKELETFAGFERNPHNGGMDLVPHYYCKECSEKMKDSDNE